MKSHVAAAYGVRGTSSLGSLRNPLREGRVSREVQEADTNPMAVIMLRLTKAIEGIAKRQMHGRAGRSRPSSFMGGRGESSMDFASSPAVAASVAPDRAAPVDDVRWSEAVDHLRVMLMSEILSVRLRVSTTLSVLAECSPKAKDEILKTADVMNQLIIIMTQGGLEAITAISVLTTDSVVACDQARDAGAIAHLAGFIVTKEDAEGGEDGMTGDPVQEAGRSNSGGIDGGQVPHEFSVPVDSKADVVTALRNIATSSARNREAITRGDQAVVRATRMLRIACMPKSPCSPADVAGLIMVSCQHIDL